MTDVAQWMGIGILAWIALDFTLVVVWTLLCESWRRKGKSPVGRSHRPMRALTPSRAHRRYASDRLVRDLLGRR